MLSTPTIQSIYTDGACIGNPGPGGWATVIYLSDGSTTEIGDREGQTTNNRMELQAVITALKILATSGQNQPITLYTDSEYVIKGITSWLEGWKKKGWKNSQRKAVANQDLWQLLDRLNTDQVKWQHVRGHSGNEGNERCDQIANAFARGASPYLTQSIPIIKVNGDWKLVISSNLHQSSSDEVQPRPAVLRQGTVHKCDPHISNTAVTGLSDLSRETAIAYRKTQLDIFDGEPTMSESSVNTMEEQQLPREVRVAQLNYLITTLRIADEIASKGYLISSSELADLMDINASAVTSRGDHWSWRNWVVSRVRREGNQILWQLEAVD